MAKQEKVPGKVKKESNKKFKIEPDKKGEVEIEIDLLEDGNYEVDKLNDRGLPTNFPMPDGPAIIWYNNFSIKKDGQYIKQTYKVRIPNLASRGKSALVIYDNIRGLYEYTGRIVDDTIELTDGDPAVGHAP